MPDSEHRLGLITHQFVYLLSTKPPRTPTNVMHVRTDSHTTPTSISTGVSFLQEKVSYICIQIQFINTRMCQYISRKKEIQLVIECWAYQQTHHTALTDSNLTDIACTVFRYGLLFVGHSWVNKLFSWKYLESLAQSLWCLVSYRVIA